MRDVIWIIIFGLVITGLFFDKCKDVATIQKYKDLTYRQDSIMKVAQNTLNICGAECQSWFDSTLVYKRNYHFLLKFISEQEPKRSVATKMP